MSDALKITAVPTPKGSDHKPVKFPELPQHEFTIGVIAPKGSGKTTTIINLLRLYKGYFHKIIIMSPTIGCDNKWLWVKKQELLTRNTELEGVLAKLKQKEQFDNHIVRKPRGASALQKILDERPVFSPRIPEEYFIEEFEDRTVEMELQKNFDMINFFSDNSQPKTLADRMLVICDDQVGADLLRGERLKDFVGINTRHRHYSASIMVVTQGYKEIPKTIRTGWTALLIYEIGNEKEVEAIFEEFAVALPKKLWWEVYRYCVKDPYAFMYINMFKPKGERIRKNFDELITVAYEDEECLPPAYTP